MSRPDIRLRLADAAAPPLFTRLDKVRQAILEWISATGIANPLNNPRNRLFALLMAARRDQLRRIELHPVGQAYGRTCKRNIATGARSGSALAAPICNGTNAATLSSLKTGLIDRATSMPRLLRPVTNRFTNSVLISDIRVHVVLHT